MASPEAAFGVELRVRRDAAANADAATGGSRPLRGSPAGGPSTPDSIRCRLSVLASGWRSLTAEFAPCKLLSWLPASLPW